MNQNRIATNHSATAADLPLPLSVYRRRRLMVLAGLVAIFGAFFAPQAADAFSGSHQVKLSYVTVHAGESLWQIAEKVSPNQDPRDFIANVMSANALTSSEVVAGQRLILPNQ
jgi:hypothetical protein